MEKIIEAKLKPELQSSKNEIKCEFMNNNKKGGVQCCKDVNGCNSSSIEKIKESQAENVGNAGNIQKNEPFENDNSVISLSPLLLPPPPPPSSSAQPSAAAVAEFLNEENLLKRRSISSVNNDSDNNDNSPSSNNSTDNLSYLSENYVVEEIFLSDEDLSRNSDDCIYAYRGGAADYNDLMMKENRLGLMNNGGAGANCIGRGIGGGAGGNDINNHNVDDDTDFLEMDFEPDPSSELEQSIEFNTHHSILNLAASDNGYHHNLQSIKTDDQCKFFDTKSDQIEYRNFMVEPPPPPMPSVLTPNPPAPSSTSTAHSNETNLQLQIQQNLNENHHHLHYCYNNAVTNISTAAPATTLNPIKYNLSDTALSSSSLKIKKITGTKRKKVLDKNSKLSGAATAAVITSKPTASPSPSSLSNTNKINSYNPSINVTQAVYSCNKRNYQKKSIECIGRSSAVAADDNHVLLIENDDGCLDCLEKEFLSKTIGNSLITTTTNTTTTTTTTTALTTIAKNTTECSKCLSTLNRIRQNRFETDQIKNLENPVLTCLSSVRFDTTRNFGYDHRRQINNYCKEGNYDDMKMMMMMMGSMPPQPAVNGGQNNQHLFVSDCSSSMQNYITENFCHLRNNINFSSLNVNEKTIVQALDKLEVTYDRDVIKDYFNSKLPREIQLIADVPQLIVYMSKKNCDYKKIIRLIKLSCNDKLHIEFIPNSNTKSLSEIVEVNVYDILQHWNRKNNLGKLKKLDKRFTEMNVLGKIINLLRQNTKPTSEFIAIPQYYKSGHICIKKI